MKDDVPASKDLPGKKSYLTTQAVERLKAHRDVRVYMLVFLGIGHFMIGNYTGKL